MTSKISSGSDLHAKSIFKHLFLGVRDFGMFLKLAEVS